MEQKHIELVLKGESSHGMGIFEYLDQLKECAEQVAQKYPFQACILVAVAIELCGRLLFYSQNENWPDEQKPFFKMAIEGVEVEKGKKICGGLVAFDELSVAIDKLYKSWRHGFCHQAAPFNAPNGCVNVTSGDGKEDLKAGNCTINVNKMIDRLDRAIVELRKKPCAFRNGELLENVLDGQPYVCTLFSDLDSPATSAVPSNFG